MAHNTTTDALPITVIEALNRATGGNEWQGDFGPYELVAPAVELIDRLTAERDAALEDARRLRRCAEAFGDVIDNHCIAMQAAVIEMHIGKGAESAMEWISNTLFGPGLYPDIDEAEELGGAQAWFDAKSAETRAGKELAALASQEGAAK